MNKKEYNGWYNYETWLCNLWHDAGWEDEVKEAVEYAIENKRDSFTIREEAAFRLADVIKEIVEDNINPDCQNGFLGDLINTALSEINYFEIAKHYIDDAKIYVAMWNMPGCLPEMEPAYFLDEDEARAYLSSELETLADDDEGRNKIIDDCKEEIEKTGGCYFEEYNYTVSEV